jgi:hypothetical protein
MSVDTQKRLRIMGTHRQLQAEIAQARGTLEKLINDSAPFDEIVEQSKQLVLAEAASATFEKHIVDFHEVPPEAREEAHQAGPPRRRQAKPPEAPPPQPTSDALDSMEEAAKQKMQAHIEKFSKEAEEADVPLKKAPGAPSVKTKESTRGNSDKELY